jgi:thymidylate synthase (FAD)
VNVYTVPEERMLHQYETAKFIVDRGVSHEIVRHRPASYAQESTRYCNYTDGKFGNELTFIEPCFFATDSGNYRAWHTAMVLTEAAYVKLIAAGAKPQEARSVLPNSLKTELWMTANAKEWYHFFSLRCAPAAHPQMQQVAKQLQAQMLPILPREEVDCDE